jgi:hypothetical protein
MSGSVGRTDEEKNIMPGRELQFAPNDPESFRCMAEFGSYFGYLNGIRTTKAMPRRCASVVT